MDYDRRDVAFRLLVGVAIVVALLVGVGWERVVQNLQTADLGIFAVAVAVSVLGMVVNAEGLRIVLDVPARGADASLVRRTWLAATFVRSLIPAGTVGGSAFVAYSVSKDATTTVSSGVAAAASWEFLTIVASAVVATAGVAGVAAGGGDTSNLVVVVVAFVAMLGVAVGLLVAVAHRRGRVVDVLLWLSSVVRRTFGRVVPRLNDRLSRPQVHGVLDSFFESVEALLNDRRRLALAVGAATLGWLLNVFPLFFSLHAVGLPVSLYVVMVVMPVAGFALALPIPGGVGPLDAALGGLLALFAGYPLGALASALVLFRVATFGPHVAIGGLALTTLDETVR
ncbi:lysylphosphatidylglycerol synthase transmembrane domain-containing protein [Halobacterium wangiae]|uniref:lysylphosphatidylglycerol synthase transmembrane domain-containing protein n=1 Tax=Halobacterium wangiae TaxID=2902623 RepID=UPI001E49DBBA|nr:lysylphosphatidylglycerol synthase transmembrane domain-containing protein [Halobacterium wangiae]